MNIARHVEAGAANYPNRVALRFEGATFSYSRLEADAGRLAAFLSQRGVVAGSRVGLYLPNCPLFVIGYLAILKIGSIAVSLNPLCKSSEVRSALHDCGAMVVISNEELAAHIPRHELPSLELVLLAEEIEPAIAHEPKHLPARDVAASAPAVIVYSSGTTGEPKGCTLSHQNVISNMAAKVKYLEIRPDDRLLLFVPLSHCFGQNAVLNAAFGGGATVVLERQFRVDETLQTIKSENPTMLFGPPAVYALLLDRAAPGDLRGLRYFFSAAAPMSVSVALRWQDTFGRVIHEGYGLTETSPFATYNHETHYRLGTVGTPIRDVQIKIVDLESGADLPAGEAGEVLIRGPNVMLGYWNRPEETSQAIRGGWLHSGDVGRLDDEGYLSLLDRIKEMINVGGLKVYPSEVEQLLRSHPCVQAVAVYGIQDPVFGEQVVADVVLLPGTIATSDDLVRLCRDRLAAYKSPSQLRIVSALPVSPTGKLLKRTLRMHRETDRTGERRRWPVP